MDVRFCEGRNHRREAQLRAADPGECDVRAPPKRASGGLRFLLTKTYMDVGKPEVIRDGHAGRNLLNWRTIAITPITGTTHL